MRKPPAQGELFPFAAPETVLAHIRRLEAMTLSVGPELTPAHCLRMLGGLALTATEFDAIVASIRSGSAWQERAALPPIASAPLEESIAPAPRWQSPAMPVTYRTPPAWPDHGFVRRRRS